MLIVSRIFLIVRLNDWWFSFWLYCMFYSPPFSVCDEEVIEQVVEQVAREEAEEEEEEAS